MFRCFSNTVTRLTKTASLLLITMLFPLHAEDATAISAETVYLVTHADSPFTDAMKQRKLRAIFTMRQRRWHTGERMTLFVLEDDARLHERFCRQVLGLLPYQLRKQWDRIIFSGQTSPPVTVSSIAQMKERIRQTPGSIGYVAAKDLDDSLAIIEVKK